jgi:hypothetical protein
MTRVIRHTIVLLAGMLGLSVAAAAPAFAGFNHTEPFVTPRNTPR